MYICGRVVMVINILFLKNLCDGKPSTRIRLNENISRYRKGNGEPIAEAHLIEEYEGDHLSLLIKGSKEDNNFEWKDLENKQLDDYCRRYLKQCVPGKATSEATGSKCNGKLHYITPNYKFFIKYIIVVTCIYQSQGKKIMYHLTKALEPNCVYALSRPRGSRGFSSTFTIIYKYCDFELLDYNRSRERKIQRHKEIYHKQHTCNDVLRKQYVKKGGCMHHRTGQVIANDKSIKEYELEHLEMYRRTPDENFNEYWPFVMQHPNLNDYCYNYLSICVPNRNHESVEGTCDLQKLQYSSIKEVSVHVIVVKCHIPSKSKRCYYFTKGVDTNCVFALLRIGNLSTDPFLIIFKYCNFDRLNIKQEVQENNDVNDHNVIPFKEVKTENSLISKTIQLFLKN